MGEHVVCVSCMHFRGYLESSGTPVNELDHFVDLDGRNGSIDVLGHHVTPVEEAHCHVLPPVRITLDHLAVGFKACFGDLVYRHQLVVCLKTILSLPVQTVVLSATSSGLDYPTVYWHQLPVGC